MYYCISCEETHKLSDCNGEVFKTGFMFFGGKKIPLGYCCSSKQTAIIVVEEAKIEIDTNIAI
ncbi:DUF3973 domain-containing protein [Paenibacillus sp. V4I7]|uniref:DUF3973 domain-containing protein n=1 Tax=unclassified Paenibacillus TaxID=185978 RepID=UPI0035940AED